MTAARTSYNLQKFVRSNQDTCINQRPSVRRGDRVKVNQILADSSSTEQGELALGQNVLVAFMPWEGWQLRGRHPDQRASGARRCLYLDPHREVRDRSARYQAGTGRGDPRYSERW
ncbi:MAG: hypothetical protein QM736_28670 [Vicinamibacterales bacterium]